ncbi:hypothetical protein Tco_0796957 [Tanacetum coccineum]
MILGRNVNIDEDNDDEEELYTECMPYNLPIPDDFNETRLVVLYEVKEQNKVLAGFVDLNQLRSSRQNSTLRRRFTIPSANNTMDDQEAPTASIDRSKASSQETLSCGDVNSLDVTSDHYVEIYQLNSHPSTIFRPEARVNAFNIYNSHDSLETQDTLILSSKAYIGISKLLEGERLVPHRCGYGCCGISTVANIRKSLLGPEFVDYQTHLVF